MRMRTRDLKRDWRRGDAERLARFFNYTGRGWPGGGWDPKTPQEAERRIREQELLGAFVAEVDGRIVSFCNVAARPGERNQAYIPFLTADPDYHGRGLGKAVLLRAVERVWELGISRVDLHTWPGNLKAVPLYKKSGFMWSPESGQWGVHMQNFTPGARRHPIARPFFDRHDWYRSLKRDLSLRPDEHRRGKVRVYPYEWEEDGDRLRLVYDRQSWGLLEVETNDFLVGCWLSDEKLVAGMPHRLRWEIVNHRDQPLDIVLFASADEGVKLQRAEQLRVARRARLEAEFEVDPQIAEKDKEPRVPIVRTDLLVNGTPLRLEAGFQVRQAIGLHLDGAGQACRPGRPERVMLQVSNELDRPARARVRVAAAGARLQQGRAILQLPAHGLAQLPLTLTAPGPGAFPLRVEAEVRSGGRTITPKPADLYAHALSPGDLVGHVERECAVLESHFLRLTIWRRGGWAQVSDKVRNRHELAGFGPPQLGPPFPWDEFFQTRAEARLERESGRVVAVLTSESVYRPGVRLERRIALSNLPLIELRDTIVNNSPDRLALRLRAGANMRAEGGAVSAPTPDGVVRGLWGAAGRSLIEHRLPEEADRWPEGWLAREDAEGAVVGLIWGRAERVEFGWGASVERSLPPLEPGASASAEPVYVFAGEGGPLAVRRSWQMLFGPRVLREQRPPETRQPLEFGLRPRPLVLHGERAQAKLVADAVGRLELDLEVEADPPAGVTIQPARASFRRVSGARPRAAAVTVQRRPRLPEGAYFVTCRARLDRAHYQERQPIIVLGDPAAEISVLPEGEGGQRLRIENGLYALTIAPAFQGAAVSLRRGREELLRSAYPSAGPMSWMNPWFGGIEPSLHGLGPGELARERFRARPVERRGSQGVLWRGVRVSCSPGHERARHSRLALDYLLAPGSAVMALVLRTARRADTPGWVGAGFGLWPVLGASQLDAVLSGPSDRRTARLRCDYSGGVGADRWVIAENPASGDAVLLACPGGPAQVGGEVFGRDGYSLGASVGATHDARQTREWPFFIAFTQAPRARHLAEVLSELKALP